MKPAERFRNFQKYTPIEPFEVLSKRLGRKMEDIVKLDANENPYGPAPAVKKVLSNLKNINIYPDPESRELREKLSEFTGVDQNLLMSGAGADELIDLILRVMLEPGDVVINCPPTFGMYPFDTRLNNGVVIEVIRNNDFSINANKIREAVTENSAKIIFLTSPNNPDGCLISDEDLKQILELPYWLYWTKHISNSLLTHQQIGEKIVALIGYPLMKIWLSCERSANGQV